MPVDSSIALGVRPVKTVSPAEVMSLRQLAQQSEMQTEQLNEIRRKRAEENALRDYWATRGDAPLSLSDVPNVMRISPSAGIKIQGELVKQEQEGAQRDYRRAQADQIRQRMRADEVRVADEAGAAALSVYDAEIANKTAPEQALAKAQSRYASILAERQRQGLLTGPQFIGIDKPFDPEQARAWVESRRPLANDVQANKPDAAPKTRTRIAGDQEIQEEFNPATGTWKEIGKGPRFARQVQPVVNVGAQEPLVPVKEPDGRVIYVPRSQAAGREVGGRTTDVNINKQVQNLGRDLEKANLPTTIAVIQQAEKVTPELASYVTGPKSLIPDIAVSAEAREARQDVAKLFNITLKDRSGAAVTNQELQRLKTEFGTGVIKTPEQLIDAIKKAKAIVQRHYQAISASYGKPVLDAYNENLESLGGSAFVNPGVSSKPRAPKEIMNEADKILAGGA